MKIVLRILHGIANVKWDFSVNSQCLIDHLKEDDLISQRTVYDRIKLSVTDIRKFEISKALVQSFKNACFLLTEAT